MEKEIARIELDLLQSVKQKKRKKGLKYGDTEPQLVNPTQIRNWAEQIVKRKHRLKHRTVKTIASIRKVEDDFAQWAASFNL